MNLDTMLLHGYSVIDKETGAASIPKYQTSTFHQENFMTHRGFSYTRFGNPTISAAEECIAALEKTTYGLAFSSGMAAINAVLFLLSKGDHIVLCKDIYGGTYQTLTEMLVRFGIEYTFVDETKSEEWAAAIRPSTKMFYMETPSNPLLKITDIKKVVAIARDNGVMTVCDNTFMTPYYQNPALLGVDVVIHSATKFLNGHSDVVAGFLALNELELYDQLKKHQKMLGGILGVEEAWLFLRGVKTLGVRLKQSVATAQKVAEFLQTKKTVSKVYYPGLKDHEGFEIHKQQAGSSGAVLSFEVSDVKQVYRLFEECSLPIVAVSLGGVESILSYPWSMSHACMPEKERLEAGVTPLIIRLSVGIEDCNDLIADLNKCIE